MAKLPETESVQLQIWQSKSVKAIKIHESVYLRFEPHIATLHYTVDEQGLV